MLLNATLYPKDQNHSETDKHSRKKIIFLHGMGGTGNLWRPIAASLEDSYFLLCPDQRGHGKSATQSGENRFSPSDFAQDVFETALHYHFNSAWVVGHSMGVRTACAYAQLHPKHVDGLILVDLGLSSGAGGGIAGADDDDIGVLTKNRSQGISKTHL